MIRYGVAATLGLTAPFLMAVSGWYWLTARNLAGEARAYGMAAVAMLLAAACAGLDGAWVLVGVNGVLALAAAWFWRSGRRTAGGAR